MCDIQRNDQPVPHFPRGRDAEEFIRAYLSAVAPREGRARDRKRRAVLPPIVLLTGGDDRAERARRALRWLDGCLHAARPHPSPKLVAHATMTADESGRPGAAGGSG
ncbi:hypothetical protein, partial [Streptomyces sp. SBT349]|uniref:hypothetical protein n=1 Tax=Streptomyces sp. SBT349 TaxID=1580539 RepID=UPI000A58284E